MWMDFPYQRFNTRLRFAGDGEPCDASLKQEIAFKGRVSDPVGSQIKSQDSIVPE
jgi:hypothetical protein